MKNISLQVRDDGVAVALMDMPGLPFNIFSEAMMADLEILIETVSNAQEKGIKALVLGSGKSAFVAGADLGMIKDFADMRYDADWQTMRNRFSTLGQQFRRLELLPVPVVAAINGLALGGGLEVSMACHARICADIPAPILGLPEIKLGLLPGAGGTQRLPRLVGVEQGLIMLLQGDPVTPQQALKMGLVDAVVAPEQLLDVAIQKAKELANANNHTARWDNDGWQLTEKDKRLLAQNNWQEYCLNLTGWSADYACLYPAVEAIVNCVGRGAPQVIDDGFTVEWDIFVDLMRDPVVANMVETVFLNKTAAGKWAKKAINSDAPVLQAMAWLSNEKMPSRLEKAFALKSADEADVLVADTGQEIAQNSTPVIFLSGICSKQAAAKPRSSATIQYVSAFKPADGVELFSPDDLASTVLEVAKLAGKTPVWQVTENGLLNDLCDALAVHAKQSGLAPQALSQAAQAVDALPFFVVALSVPEPNAKVNAQDMQNGLQLLAAVALDCLPLIADKYAEADVLAVLGMGWPKWTGGPVSYLAMLQRNEVKLELSETVSQALASIAHSIKVKSSYNPS